VSGTVGRPGRMDGTTATAPTDTGGAYLPGGAHIPVPALDGSVEQAALITVAAHATSPSDYRDLVAALGLGDALDERAARPPAVLEPAPAAPEPDGPVCPHPDVFTAWDQSGRPFAVCAVCAGEWRGGPCVGCGLPVRAERVARAGGVVVHGTAKCQAAAAAKASQQEEAR
jgi:hypothetical protein